MPKVPHLGLTLTKRQRQLEALQLSASCVQKQQKLNNTLRVTVQNGCHIWSHSGPVLTQTIRHLSMIPCQIRTKFYAKSGSTLSKKHQRPSWMYEFSLVHAAAFLTACGLIALAMLGNSKKETWQYCISCPLY